MSTVLLLLSILAFVILAILGFDFLVDPDSDPHFFGWAGLGLALLAASFLPLDRWRGRQ